MAADQLIGTLGLRSKGAARLGSDDHHRLGNAATPGILGLCQTAGGCLFELHCETDESLLSSRFGLEQDGNAGGPEGQSCRTVGFLGGWRARCGGLCLGEDLGHLGRWKGGFRLS